MFGRDLRNKSIIYPNSQFLENGNEAQVGRYAKEGGERQLGD